MQTTAGFSVIKLLMATFMAAAPTKTYLSINANNKHNPDPNAICMCVTGVSC